MGMTDTAAPLLSGRRAQAARNDETIIAAAREVFLADPTAPIAVVAEAAGVGISALYRRYRSKDDLLLRLCQDGMSRYLDEARSALTGLDRLGTEAMAREPAAREAAWGTFSHFMINCVDAGAGSLTVRLAGAVPPSAELERLSTDLYAALTELVDRLHEAGILRSEITEGDLSLVFEQLQAVSVPDPGRSAELRRRYLTLLLEAFREGSLATLPGPAPSLEEISGRYGR